MAIRLSGMNSGLDTDSIVKALVSGYTTKKEKYEKENINNYRSSISSIIMSILFFSIKK